MIGYFNYSEILTYLSAISAGVGIIVALQGNGHPYLGVFFLLFCGLCDAFDGKVARMKKDRGAQEQKFGIQIDSLSDLVAFGVLPACIGDAMIRVCPTITEVPRLKKGDEFSFPFVVILFAILMLYILAALIRLAYFNVIEEERQNTEAGVRKSFVGLPVTTAALAFPTVLLLQYLIPADLTLLYFAVMLVMTVLFLAKIKVPKPGTRGMMVMVILGLIEFIFLIVGRNVLH